MLGMLTVTWDLIDMLQFCTLLNDLYFQFISHLAAVVKLGLAQNSSQDHIDSTIIIHSKPTSFTMEETAVQTQYIH